MTTGIAIVGMSCRLPGAPDLEAFWRLLSEGRSAITKVPAERWDLAHLFDENPLAAGKVNTAWGGFIEGADQFDPHFFAMSHEEATIVDPQQRMMLELGWQALEHAGMDPNALKRTPVGVYVGISHNDYERITCRDQSRITRFHGTGAYQSMAANRLSYFLDTVGPSLTVDTACSSGLAALHVACQHLLSGEIPLAVIGAVTLHLTPEETIGLTKGRLLSPDGQCKSFDEAANGYVRAEGGVSMVLRRLDDALADGNRVLAVIKGSAVNHNGRSNGLSAPNGPALRAVMQQALSAAEVHPDQVDFVETHGTGTPLGDQLELKALCEVYGDAGGDAPCWLGCLKTNMGHLETTSGLAGLAKAVLALQYGIIPPNLNFAKVPAHVDLSGSRLAIPIRPEPWPPQASPRYAAVTAYGFGGANAHVIVEASPQPKAVAPASLSGAQLLCLSAPTAAAHRDVLTRYANHLAQSTDAFQDICFTAAVGRAHFDYRSAFVVHSAAEAAQHIRAELASADEAQRMPMRVKLVMSFPATGSRGEGVDDASWKTRTAYRAAWARCMDAARSVAADADAADSRVTAFAHAYAMAQLWFSWGVKPAALSGRGLGELVAAAVADAMTLPQAMQMLLGVQRVGDLAEPRLPLIDPRTGDIVALDTQAQGADIEAHAAGDDYTALSLIGLVMRVGDDVGHGVRAALRALYLAGIKLPWNQVFGLSDGRRVDLPQHPFQRVRCWFEPTVETRIHHLEEAAPHAPERGKAAMQRAAMVTSARAADRVAWLQGYARRRINSRLIDERRCIAPNIVLDFGNEGLMGLLVPTTWGGQGFGVVDSLRVFEQAGAIDLTLASFLGVHNVLGTLPILQHGSSALHDTCLPRLASGRELGAFAVTESGAGSHPRAMRSSATFDGRGAWTLDGSKVWIGSAGWSKVIAVFAYAHDEGGRPLGLTGFAVGADDEGVGLGPEALTMGVRGMVQNALTFRSVKVRDDHRLGAVGDGMHVAQETMAIGRLGIGAASLGAMKRCIQLVEQFAVRRSIAGGALGSNTTYLSFLDTALSMTDAVAALVDAAAQRVDRREVVAPEVFAAVKVMATESLGYVVDMGMQFTGGRGYIDTNPLSQLFRDARLMRIFEGPTETLLSHIGSALAGGGRGVHEFIDSLGAPGIAALLHHRLAPLVQPVTGRPLHGMQWCEIGRVACAAMVWAAVDTCAPAATGSPSESLSRWCEARFVEAAATAGRRIAHSSDLDGDALRRRATQLTGTIGDVDQRAAGAETEVDPVWVPAEDRMVSPTTNAASGLSAAAPQLPSRGHTDHHGWLCQLVAEHLRRPVDDIDIDAPFNDFGVDSIAAVEIALAIERRIGTAIDVTVLWSYPNVGALARYLATLGTKPVAPPATAEAESIADQLRRELDIL